MIPENNDEIGALKSQTFILLIALIVVSGTLTIFLFRQASLANKDITELQRLSSQTVTNEMVLRSIVVKLQNFGSRHADYQAILKKDGFAPAGAAAPATAPAPATPHK
jgi:hypothetical protein